MIARADWLPILDAACRAISPYNTQPWRFRWAGDDVDVFLIRTKNFFLKLGGVSFMTLGHFLENFSTAALASGYEAHVDILGAHLNLDSPIARLRLQPGLSADAKLMKGLERRVTNRLPFSRCPLEPEDLAVLEPVLGREGQNCAHWLVGEEQKIAGEILADLERVRLSNHKLLREAYDYIRFDDAEYRRTRDRLYVETLLLDSLSRRALSVLAKRPALHRLVKIVAPGMLRRQREQKYQEYQQASGLIVYTVDQGEYLAYIELGRRIQRTLNVLSAAGVQSHAVLSGLYLLHLAFENIEIFSRAERDLILFALRDLENLLSTPSRNIAFVVRVGYCAEWPEPTLRKEASSLFL